MMDRGALRRERDLMRETKILQNDCDRRKDTVKGNIWNEILGNGI